MGRRRLLVLQQTCLEEQVGDVVSTRLEHVVFAVVDCRREKTVVVEDLREGRLGALECDELSVADKRHELPVGPRA